MRVFIFDVKIQLFKSKSETSKVPNPPNIQTTHNKPLHIDIHLTTQHTQILKPDGLIPSPKRNTSTIEKAATRYLPPSLSFLYLPLRPPPLLLLPQPPTPHHNQHTSTTSVVPTYAEPRGPKSMLQWGVGYQWYQAGWAYKGEEGRQDYNHRHHQGQSLQEQGKQEDA